MILTSGPRLTTTFLSITRVFTILVLLMITLVVDSGTRHVRTRGARKSRADTKTKGPAALTPKRADTPTVNPGETGAHPI